VAGGRRPPPRGGHHKDAVAVAAAGAAANNKDKDGGAAAAAAARLARATAAGAALRRLAAGSPARVTLRTVYVRGVARESRTWRLRQLLSGVAGLPERAVVDVDRFGDLAAVRLLATHADAFEAAVALSPAADTLTLVRGVDALSPSLLGAPRRRGLSEEAARTTARAFFVARTTAKLASLDERVGMPPAHRDALRQLLHRELAPHVRQLADGGGAAGGCPAPLAVEVDVATARRGGAARRAADRESLVPPAAVAVAAAAMVDADGGADENFPPAASTPAWTSNTPSEISVPPPTPSFLAAVDGDAVVAENFRADVGGADPILGVGKQVVTTTVTAPTPCSDRVPLVYQTNSNAAVPQAGSMTAARTPPSPPLADKVAAAVGRAPGGAVGALSLAAAFFRVARGAVAEAADAASTPRHLDPAAAAMCAEAAETRGVCIAAAAAATANIGLAPSGAARPRLQTQLAVPAQLAADVDGARRAEAELRRATSRIVAAQETPVAVARRMRAAALVGAARRARLPAARDAARAARADAAAAALVRLPPDAGHVTSRFEAAADLYTPAAGARAPPPTPAAKRRVRVVNDAASGALRAGVAGTGPVGVAGRTRAAALRGTALADTPIPSPAAAATGATAPGAVRDAGGVSRAPRASSDSSIEGGDYAAPQPQGWRDAGAPRSTVEKLGRAAAAVAPVASPSENHDVVPPVAPADAPPSVSDATAK